MYHVRGANPVVEEVKDLAVGPVDGHEGALDIIPVLAGEVRHIHLRAGAPGTRQPPNPPLSPFTTCTRIQPDYDARRVLQGQKCTTSRTGHGWGPSQSGEHSPSFLPFARARARQHS